MDLFLYLSVWHVALTFISSVQSGYCTPRQAGGEMIKGSKRSSPPQENFLFYFGRDSFLRYFRVCLTGQKYSCGHFYHHGKLKIFSLQASLGGCGKGLLNEPTYSNCQNINVNRNMASLEDVQIWAPGLGDSPQMRKKPMCFV